MTNAEETVAQNRAYRMTESEKRSLLEQRARTLFAVYSDAAGAQPAWEHLREEERRAWLDVAAFGDDCPTCGDALVCVDCS
jgi:hypothetical protein